MTEENKWSRVEEIVRRVVREELANAVGRAYGARPNGGGLSPWAAQVKAAYDAKLEQRAAQEREAGVD